MRLSIHPMIALAGLALGLGCGGNDVSSGPDLIGPLDVATVDVGITEVVERDVGLPLVDAVVDGTGPDAAADVGVDVMGDVGPDAMAPDVPSHLAAVLEDNEPDDVDDSAPVSGLAFTTSAFVTAPPCSRRSYTRVNDCYNEVHPPAPTIMRSLTRAHLEPAADTVPHGTKVAADGSVDHVGKVQVLPSTRSTVDGRLSVSGGCDGCDSFRLAIFRPENVGYDTTVVDSTRLIHPLGTDPYHWFGSSLQRFVLWDPTHSRLTGNLTDGNGNLHQADVLQSTICENASDRVSTAFSGATVVAETRPDNPRTCQARFGEADALEVGDCYDVSILAGTTGSQSGARWELRSVALTVFVRDPKRTTTGRTAFPEGASNPFWAYPRDPTGAMWSAELQTLPPFVRFEFNGAFQVKGDGSKLLACPDATGRDMTGAAWWECFSGNKYPNAQRFMAQISGPSGHCFDGSGNRRSGAPGFCEYFFQQHYAEDMTVDDDADDEFGNGRTWNGRSSGCGSDRSCIEGRSMFEPITTGDGRLLFINLGGVFYAYNDLGECRADGFVDFHPYSWMPADPDVKTTYDMAKTTRGAPFRDTMGEAIPFGTLNTGAYPWVDRRGRNLFYAAQNLARDGWFARQARFFDYGGNFKGARTIPSATEQVSAADRQLLNPDHGPGSQYAVIGSWTRGKAVLVDELNVGDFGGGDSIGGMPDGAVGQLTSYDINLYSDSAPTVFRSKGVQSVNSFEHMLGYVDAMRPVLPFDVVWQMQTDIQRNVELAFDPYLNPRALVVAHMNAPLNMHEKPLNNKLKPRASAFVLDGFTPTEDTAALVRFGATVDFRYTTSPLLQNAAVGGAGLVGTSVVPPPYLTVRGGARVEPVGMGGVIGKGLYLDGYNDHIEIAVPFQAGVRDFEATLWLDPRDADLGVRPRVILQFADQSFIGLRAPSAGQRELVFYSAADERLRALPVTGLIVDGHWAHLGVAVRGGGDDRVMDVRVNGTWLGRLHFNPSTNARIGFELVNSGAFAPAFVFVGHPGPRATVAPALKRRTFRGWVDELRIYAVSAEEQVDPSFAELACNEALGTMVDIESRSGETEHAGLDGLRALAERFPAGTTAVCEQLVVEPRAGESLQGVMLPKQYDDRLCADRVHHNARDAADLAARCERAARLEIPVGVWDAPRADSSGAPFCLSCHFSAGDVDGLKPGALRPMAGVPRWLDPRRQPLHVPARVGGQRHDALWDAGLEVGDPEDKFFDVHGFLRPLDE